MTDTRELATTLKMLAALPVSHRSNDEIDDAMTQAADTITALYERCRALEDALQFYADTGKYPAPLTGGCGDLYFDCGQVARAALAGGRG